MLGGGSKVRLSAMKRRVMSIETIQVTALAAAPESYCINA